MCNEKMIELTFDNLVDADGNTVKVMIPESSLSEDKIQELKTIAARAIKTAQALKNGESPYKPPLTEGKTRSNTKFKTKSLWDYLGDLSDWIKQKLKRDDVSVKSKTKLPEIGEVWKERNAASWDALSVVVVNVEPDWVQYKILESRSKILVKAGHATKLHTVYTHIFVPSFAFTGETRPVAAQPSVLAHPDDN